MSTLFAAGILLGVVTPLAAGPLGFEISERGVVTFSDGQPLARASVGMFAPGWIGASNDGAATAAREGSRTTGFFSLPGASRGALHYTVDVQRRDEAVELAYSIEFDEATEIQSAQVSFFLPTDRFEGHAATLWRSGARATLPRPGESLSLGGNACGVSVELGDGKALAIIGNAVGSVRLQDNRQWGAQEYEVRFNVFSEGQVAPGIRAERTFTVAIVPADQVASLVDQVIPRVTFDPSKPFALLRSKGEITVGTQQETLVTVQLSIHGLEWAYSAQSDAQVQVGGDSRRRFVSGVLPVPAAQGQTMEFLESATATPEGALALAYRLHFPRAVALNGYQVSFNMALARYAGETITLQTPQGEREVVIPREHGGNFLFTGPVTGLTVAPGKAPGFTLAVDQPSSLLVQDNRGWGGNDIELRFNFRRQEAREQVPAGETVQRAFTFALHGPLQVVLDEAAATSETDTTDWIPYTLPWDDCPVDVSFLNHKPAGKYGFVTVRDGRFVLSDTGEEIRFWGTCFSAGANFPTHEQSERIARRLARFGVNMVRTHHADAQWSERSFFKRDADNTREFDPESLDRFDYLIYCLKREGIYIYLDQLVNRYFKPGDGVDAVDQLGACAKPYSNFDPRLIELQQEFSRNLWTHVNPYTGLAYKDDPAIALMEFANENDLFAMPVTLEPYRTRLEAMFRQWAAENGIPVPPGPVNFQQRSDDIMRFLVHVQRKYYQDMTRFLREEVGVRVPMTGSNWTINAALLAALQDMPFTDSHAYWHHPTGDGAVGNTPMVAAPVTFFGALAFQRMVDKPFFVSEWDEPWPNEWRAELPGWMAAMAGFQRWNGLTVYTYRHTSSVPVDRLSGAFETFNDPARFGLFPAAALMFRRGDVAPAREWVAVTIPQEMAQSARTPAPWNAPTHRALPELHGLATALVPEEGAPGGPDLGGFSQVVPVGTPMGDMGDERQSDTGQLWRSISRKLLRVDTPRSQMLTGYLGSAGELATADMTLTCQSLFATIALSSLTDEPIRESGRLLLTAVGRAENTGFRYNMLRNKVITEGTGPILVDPIQARVAVRTNRPNLTVWAIGPDGSRVGQVPAQTQEGSLVFEIGPAAKTIYYEIIAGQEG